MSDAEMSDVEMEEERPQGVTSDPYLLEDAKYIKSETRWKNRQRTLVFASRGISGRHRHLMEDLRRIMPHHKAESKFDKNESFGNINEICELRSCNNCVFFESRRQAQHVFMWLGRVPAGPTFKFQLLNVITSAELKMSGNCLHGSRPFVCFDGGFDSEPHYALMKELLSQTFGTPRNHPKSKPFFDHVISFHLLDGKIWFRHYQISPTADSTNPDDPEEQELTEIGPRFVLEPVCCLEGSFSGRKIWDNTSYMTPVQAKRAMKEVKGKAWKERVMAAARKEQQAIENAAPEDPLEETFA